MSVRMERLSNEYRMIIYEEQNQVKIGQTTVNLSGPLHEGVEAIRHIFVMGMAAKQSQISRTAALLKEMLNEIIIVEGDSDDTGG